MDRDYCGWGLYEFAMSLWSKVFQTSFVKTCMRISVHIKDFIGGDFVIEGHCGWEHCESALSLWSKVFCDLLKHLVDLNVTCNFKCKQEMKNSLKVKPWG